MKQILFTKKLVSLFNGYNKLLLNFILTSCFSICCHTLYAQVPVITNSGGTQIYNTDVPFAFQISATNSPTSYSISGLPTGIGLTFHPTTGLLINDGTQFTNCAAMSSPIIITFTATNANGTSTTGQFQLIILLPTVTSPIVTNTINLTVGSTITNPLIGITQDYIGGIGYGNLPPGVSVTTDPNFNNTTDSFLLAGIPTSAGVYIGNVYYTLPPCYSNTIFTTITANLPGVSTINSTTITDTVGNSLNYALAGTNSPTKYKALTTLPAGLSLDTLTGIISGTPTTQGSYPCNIQTTNSSGNGYGMITFNIPEPSPVITSPLTATGTVGEPFSYTATATNNPYSFDFASPSYPAFFNNNFDVLSGIPTSTGTTVFTLVVSNVSGSTSQPFTVTINANDNAVCDHPQLIPTGTIQINSAPSTSFCTSADGFQYYADQLTGTTADVAIDPNGNESAFNSANTSLTVSATNNGVFAASDGTDSSHIMDRMITIVAPGVFTNNGGVKVRIYYDPTEETGQIPATSFSTSSWFKFSGTISNVLSALTPTGINGATYLTPDSSGIENGISFVQFNNITSFSTFGFVGFSDPVVLPIRIVSFTGTVSGCNASINWETATEENINHYEVESATDGGNWISIGKEYPISKNASGISSYSYPTSFVNDLPAYFRIKIINTDNTFSYTPIIKLQCEDQAIPVTLSPNPSYSKTTLTGLNSGDKISLVTSDGETLLNTVAVNNSFDIYTQSLSPGIYFVKIVGAKNVVLKLVVEK